MKFAMYMSIVQGKIKIILVYEDIQPYKKVKKHCTDYAYPSRATMTQAVCPFF